MIYVTASPCWNCFQADRELGIRAIVYGEFYRDDEIFDVASKLSIDLQHLQSHVPAPRRE